MFTGIITDIGAIKAIEKATYHIACNYLASTIDLGASIACDGCCLTLTSVEPTGPETALFTVDVSPETRKVTTLSNWQQG